MTEKGLVATLITDRDEALVARVFADLSRALQSVEGDVDLAVSLRRKDRKARLQSIAHRPRRIRDLRLFEAAYEAIWSGSHQEAQFQAICAQRNALRELALDEGYDWLLFLDSDVSLAPETLSRLLEVREGVVHAPYRPRWSAHVVVGVFDENGRVRILVNPECLEVGENTFPCAMVAAGCTLIRADALDVAFEVADYGFVRGEDIGFCMNLAGRGIEPRCLARHHVEHRCRPWDRLLVTPGDGDSAFHLDESELVRRASLRNV